MRFPSGFPGSIPGLGVPLQINMELRINKPKFELFLEITALLNKRFNVVPVLYGSLGLNRAIGEFCESSDVDVLIPKVYLKETWGEFRNFIEGHGFVLKDEHEHEFERSGLLLAFGKEEELKTFAGIDYATLTLENIGETRFKVLNPPQYLQVYELMRRDKYRVEKRGKQDLDKIERIKKFLDK